MFSALSAYRRGVVRVAAVTLVTGLAVAGTMAGVGAAVAEAAPQQHGGATATIGGLKIFGEAVVHEHGTDQKVSAGLFEMKVDDGGTLQTYCIDIHNPTQRGARYEETPWSGTSLQGNPDAGRISWILRNSYPQVNDLAALARKAGAASLTEQDAAAGTQVAVWRYSDGADVNASSPAAEKLADYLQKSARNIAEPEASLNLEPSAVSGHPGERLGPVTVRTNAGQVTITPPADSVATGVRVVDKDGNPVTTAANGSKLFFDVPQDAMDGAAALTVQASTTIPVGRAFASDSRSQTQILAGSSESTVSALATANWAKQGPIPAISAERNCAANGIDITVANTGDQPFGFELLGIRHSIAAGASDTVTVPLQEDQAYDFTIKGPNGLEKRFTGVLDCRTQSDTATQVSTQLGPASVGGTSSGQDLAETGSSDAIPMIVVIAVALVVAGCGPIILARRKNAPARQ